MDTAILAERAAYADLDLAVVHDAARRGPADLTAFLAALRDHLDDTTAATPGCD